MGRRTDTLAGTLELLVLKALAHSPNHGFGITLHIETASDGLLTIEEGSLYPALHRMEREKLILGSWCVTENGRRAKIYKLTGAGTKRLAEIEAHWTITAKGVQKVLRFA